MSCRFLTRIGSYHQKSNFLESFVRKAFHLFWFPSFVVTCPLIFPACSSPHTIPSKPNIILLLADDLGYADLSAHGSTVFETPYLDKLADQSVQFTNFYVNPVCAPSRASLLTGRHYLRTGVSHVHGGKDYIHLDETLLSETLRINGYATGMWGKWHSGITNGYLPWDRGFDEAYVANLYKHENTKGFYNREPVSHSGWADSVNVDYAIDFIERNQKAGKPYFAFLPFLAPHQPIKAPEYAIDHFRQKGLSENFAKLAGMIYHLDQQVGRLLKYLENEHQLENTLVIFLSDNGPQFLYGLLNEQEEELRNHIPHRGHKGNIWELGVKSPLFISAPWLTPRQEPALTGIQDLYPTLVELAGGKFSENQLLLDGLNLNPVLLRKDTEIVNQRILINFASRGWAPSKEIPYTLEGIKDEYAPINTDSLKADDQIMSVYHKSYKFLLNAQKRDDQTHTPPKQLLYHYLNDPQEENNLALKQPELTKDMSSIAYDWIENLKRESHAFAMPIFQIKYSVPENVIKTNAPVAKSSHLKNTVIDIRDWKQAGDFAVYHLDVEKGGEYDIYLPENTLLKGQHFQFTITTDGDSAHRINTAMDQSRIGAIHLKKGLQKLKIELVPPSHLSDSNTVYTLSQLLVKPKKVQVP